MPRLARYNKYPETGVGYDYESSLHWLVYATSRATLMWGEKTLQNKSYADEEEVTSGEIGAGPLLNKRCG